MSVEEILVAVGAAILAAELFDCLCWLAKETVRRAAYLRYGDTERAEVRAAEWEAVIEERPGQILKLVTAIGFLISGMYAAAQRRLHLTQQTATRPTGRPAASPTVAARSLWRNRDFNLLWSSQALSDLGDSVAQLAMPLLVLALTGSVVRAGLVGTVAQLARLLTRLPSGVLADRVDRRQALLTCDAIRLVAFATLAAAIATGHVDLMVIFAVSVIDAVCGTLFQTTEHAALRSVVGQPVAPGPTGEPSHDVHADDTNPVPRDFESQLGEAVARNEARSYGTALAGPPLGGLLFGLAPALPFLGNAVSYLASMTGIAMIRRPLQNQPDQAPAGSRTALAEGIKFVFGNRFLRAVLIIAAPLNLALNGAVFTIIVTLQRRGVAPGVIGLTETIVAVGGLAGAFIAPTLKRSIPFPRLIRSICWASTAVLVISSLLTATLAAAVPVAIAVFLGPACNAALFAYQAAITPDRLQGRVLSVIFMAAMSTSAAAPVLSGLIVARMGSQAAVLCFAGAVSIAALTATFASGVRTMRPLDDVTSN